MTKELQEFTRIKKDFDKRWKKLSMLDKLFRSKAESFDMYLGAIVDLMVHENKQMRKEQSLYERRAVCEAL